MRYKIRKNNTTTTYLQNGLIHDLPVNDKLSLMKTVAEELLKKESDKVLEEVEKEVCHHHGEESKNESDNDTSWDLDAAQHDKAFDIKL